MKVRLRYSADTKVDKMTLRDVSRTTPPISLEGGTGKVSRYLAKLRLAGGRNFSFVPA